MVINDPILIDLEVQGGTPGFAGTRVPVRSLFDSLKRGRSVDYFLSQFSAIRRDRVDAILDGANEMVAAGGPWREVAARNGDIIWVGSTTR